MGALVVAVEKIKCGGCTAKCEAALKELPGFVSAEFDIPGKRATVHGTPDPQAVVAALARAGYPARVLP